MQSKKPRKAPNDFESSQNRILYTDENLIDKSCLSARVAYKLSYKTMKHFFKVF